MVIFSCFSTNIHHPRPRKLAQQSAESMSKAYEDFSQGQMQKVSGDSGTDPSSRSVEQGAGFAGDSCLNQERPSDSSPEVNAVDNQKIGLNQTKSLGSSTDRGRVSGVTDSEDEIDREFSGNHSDEKDSTEDTKQLDGVDGESTDRSPHEFVNECGYQSPGKQPIFAKSCSVPNMDLFSYASNEGSSFPEVVHHGRSFEELNTENEKGKTTESDVEFHTKQEPDRDDDMVGNTKDKGVAHGNGYEHESYDYHLGEHLTVSRMDAMVEHEGELSVQNLNALPNKDFKIKRIEEWVSMIDLDESGSIQDTGESSHSVDRVKKGTYMLGNASTAKVDSKGTHGMEAAKNYVSSLPAASTAPQLTNLGLIVVPFLVKITSGALPRGLHVLNLAKNSISLIEGLRELTRLRVLDLSYNKILRIGHGLASCSSLKELYLAGNKISDVEGLHRLLKLKVLDLRFNKISTAKCLGQLAANYTSLQAINLEGNPAQRNVGDDQLKKYLQSILLHLVYFNKQTINASSSKEVAYRSGRSAIASHQLDRIGLRSEHKLVRKGNSIVSSGKVSSSSSHGHRVQVVTSQVQPRDGLGRLPPSGAKGSHRHHYLELGSKLLGLQSGLSMRPSRSEGNLGAS